MAIMVAFAGAGQLFLPGRAFATSVGPNNPTAATTSANGTSTNWSTATNVFTQNSAYATASLASGATSYYIVATGYGFSLPSTAVVDGVVATIYESVSATSTKAQVQDANVYIVKAGSIQTTATNQAQAAAYTATNTSYTYGSATDLWGTTLAYSDVNNAGFGVAVSAKNVKISGSGATLTAQVDWVGVTVYYHVASLFNQASYRVFSNQDASGTANLYFSTASNYTTGSAPQSIAEADFNGDGKPDLAVGDTNNGTGTTVSVLLNNGDGTFGTNTDYTTGTDPSSVVAGDFNGDGKPDLAVANVTSNTVSILLNQGNGTFGTKTDYTTGSSPQSVTAADFNGDGKVDLAVVNYSSSTVSIFLGTGTGTFGTKTDYTTGSTPRSVTAADFNGDGKVDLAVANNGVSSVSILLGNGDGTFGAKSDITAASALRWVTTGDFNGDGKTDLAVTGTGLSVFLGNGDGTFGTRADYTTGSNPYTVAAADINGDGKVDLAVGNELSDSVSIFINNGSGTFAPKTDFNLSVAPWAVTAADLNGDGKPDLAIANSVNATVMINASSPPIDVGTPLAALNTAATAPGDGQAFRVRMDIGVSQADLAASGQSFKLQYAPLSTSCAATPSANFNDVTDTSTVRYYDNSVATNIAAITTDANDPTDGTNTTANGGVIPETYQEKGTTTFTNPTAVTAGKDGMWDFALTTYHTLPGTHYCLRITSSTGTVLNTYTNYPEIITPATTYRQGAYRWFNKGAGGGGSGTITFAAKTDYTVGSTPYQAVACDVNKDGKPDIVSANGAGNSISVLINNGDGTFAPKVDYTAGTNAHAVACGDFNGDGYMDLAVPNYNANNVSVFINNGNGTFKPQVTYNVGANPQAIVTADVNGDGKLDLVVANNTDNTISVLTGTGTGTFNTQVTYSTGSLSSPDSLVAGDFNGDGKTDIAAGSSFEGSVQVLLNSGTGTFPTVTSYSSGGTYPKVGLADLNSDGKLDIITANPNSNSIGRMLGVGDGTFGAGALTAATGNPPSVTSADFNGDGKADVASVSGGTTAQLFTGNGNGTFNTPVNLTTGAGNNFVAAADFNGDGMPDLVVDNNTDSTVSVLLNTTSPGASVGNSVAGNNSAFDLNSLGTPYRLRLDIAPVGSGVAATGVSFKLQYAVKNGSCAASSFSDITTSTPVQWYDDASLTSGTAASSSTGDPVDGSNTNVPQTYQEANNFSNTQSAVYVGQDGLWDFSLVVPIGTRPGTDICLRAVTSTGTVLSSYSVYPEIQFGPQMTQLMRGGKWFDANGSFAGYFLGKY